MIEKKILLTCLFGLIALAGCVAPPTELQHSSILKLSTEDEMLVSPDIMELAKTITIMIHMSM